MSDFRMEKWYMDATDENGRAFIGYSARLRWKHLQLSYNGYTFFDGLPGSKIIRRNSFSLRTLPSLTNDVVTWAYPGVKGQWTRIDNPIGEVLFNDQQDLIDWNCLSPKSAASISVGNTSMQNALGYVEKIELGIPPWKIPIRELHWGRFLSDGHTLIWIHWVGPHPKTLVFYNGRRITDAEISAGSVDFEGYSLALDQKTTIRKGSLISTVFSKFVSITKLFPKNIFQLNENKWLSAGALKKGEKVLSTGNAIHEHVLWQ